MRKTDKFPQNMKIYNLETNIQGISASLSVRRFSRRYSLTVLRSCQWETEKKVVVNESFTKLAPSSVGHFSIASIETVKRRSLRLEWKSSAAIERKVISELTKIVLSLPQIRQIDYLLSKSRELKIRSRNDFETYYEDIKDATVSAQTLFAVDDALEQFHSVAARIMQRREHLRTYATRYDWSNLWNLRWSSDFWRAALFFMLADNPHLSKGIFALELNCTNKISSWLMFSCPFMRCDTFSKCYLNRLILQPPVRSFHLFEFRPPWTELIIRCERYGTAPKKSI